LRAVQKRRTFPTHMTQRAQAFMQNRVMGPALRTQNPTLPLPVEMLRRWPVLRRIPARLVGMGVRPEHVKTTEKR